MTYQSERGRTIIENEGNLTLYRDNIIPDYNDIDLFVESIDKLLSSKQNYDIMNTIKLPIQFLNPPDKDSVSILISSLNT